MLFDSDWIVSTTLVGEVVCKNHTFLAIYHTNARDHVSRRDLLVVPSELADFKEG